MTDFTTVQLEKDPRGFATLWLNRPDKNNAFNAQMIGELIQALDQLAKAAQAVQAALHGLLAELAFLIQAGGQLDLLAEPLEDADFAVVGLGQHHVEAVGAQVDGGDQGQVLRDGMRHDLVVLGR